MRRPIQSSLAKIANAHPPRQDSVRESQGAVSRGAVIALGCAVAVLIGLLRMAGPAVDPEPAPDARPSTRDRSTADRREPVGSVRMRTPAGLSRGESPRRRLPSPDEASTRDRASRQIAAGGAPAGADPPLARRDLPAVHARGANGDPALDDADVEPPPDVAYDSGSERVFDTGSQVELTDAGALSPQAGTIAFWLEPDWERGDPSGASFIRVGDTGLQLTKNGSSLRFEFIDEAGVRHGGAADIAAWQSGEARHVVATWNGNTLALYLDGSQIFLNTPSGSPNFVDNRTIYVGSAAPGSAPGRVSDLTLLRHTASPDEVRQMLGMADAP